MTTPKRHIGFDLKLAYAAPAFALAVVGIPIYVYLPKFYTDVIGVDMAAVGALLLAVRIFDAVTDPLIGHLSDNTRTRFGRRRPYIALGAMGVAAALVFLFNPPQASPNGLVLWFGAWLFVLFIFWTVVTVPYEALGPEITFDYDERTSLFSLRDGFLIAGTLLAAASPKIAEGIGAFLGQPATEQSVFFMISAGYAPLIVAFSIYCTWRIKERRNLAVPAPGGRAIRDMATVLKNKPFVILLAAYTISAFGSNLPATLILYYVEYVLQASGAEGFLMLYFVTGIAFLPFWIRVSRRIGKKHAWLISMAVNTGAFMGVFFLGAGDVWLYGLLVFLSGIGFGAGLALPSAIQADVIDYDELLTGRRNEGRYIGFWSIAKKLAAALGVGVALSVLGKSGYEPNVVQNEQVVFVLRTLYALVPSLCNFAAMVLVFAYPITKARHDEIRREIGRRAGNNKAGVPA